MLVVSLLFSLTYSEAILLSSFVVPTQTGSSMSCDDKTGRWKTMFSTLSSSQEGGVEIYQQILLSPFVSWLSVIHCRGESAFFTPWLYLHLNVWNRPYGQAWMLYTHSSDLACFQGIAMPAFAALSVARL